MGIPTFQLAYGKEGGNAGGELAKSGAAWEDKSEFGVTPANSTPQAHGENLQGLPEPGSTPIPSSIFRKTDIRTLVTKIFGPANRTLNSLRPVPGSPDARYQIPANRTPGCQRTGRSIL